MKRREFLTNAPRSALSGVLPLALSSSLSWGGPLDRTSAAQHAGRRFSKPRDFKKEPFKRFVIMGESTAHGGPWQPPEEGDRYPDALERPLNTCPHRAADYHHSEFTATAV